MLGQPVIEGDFWWRFSFSCATTSLTAPEWFVIYLLRGGESRRRVEKLRGEREDEEGFFDV